MKAPIVRFMCAAVALAAVTYAVATFPRGVHAFLDRRNEISAAEKRVEELEKENQRMEDRIKRLTNDPDEQELMVKEWLKYVGPKERVFVTGKPEKKK